MYNTKFVQKRVCVSQLSAQPGDNQTYITTISTVSLSIWHRHNRPESTRYLRIHKPAAGVQYAPRPKPIFLNLMHFFGLIYNPPSPKFNENPFIRKTFFSLFLLKNKQINEHGSKHYPRTASPSSSSGNQVYNFSSSWRAKYSLCNLCTLFKLCLTLDVIINIWLHQQTQINQMQLITFTAATITEIILFLWQ